MHDGTCCMLAAWQAGRSSQNTATAWRPGVKAHSICARNGCSAMNMCAMHQHERAVKPFIR